MPLWMRKPLIGLVILLLYPWVGLSGRADASFLLPQQQDGTERGAMGLPLGAHLEGEPQGTSPAPAESPAPGPGQAPAPGKRAPAHMNLQNTGTSTSSESSSSGGAGSTAGAVCFLPGEGDLNANTRGGALFLLEQRNHPKPFSSRLFRPPRVVA